MTNILSKWQSLANKNKAESGEKKSKKEGTGSSEDKDAKTTVQGNNISITMHLFFYSEQLS